MYKKEQVVFSNESQKYTDHFLENQNLYWMVYHSALFPNFLSYKNQSMIFVKFKPSQVEDSGRNTASTKSPGTDPDCSTLSFINHPVFACSILFKIFFSTSPPSLLIVQNDIHSTQFFCFDTKKELLCMQMFNY
jgi:hypothetical protein